MRNITLKKAFLSFLMFTGVAGLAQVTLIDPNGDGGFENGTTFAANGWTEVNPTGQTARIWYVGTGMSGYSGTGAAFIGDNATTVSAGSASRTVHFYRSISIPAGAENIQLKFKYKQPLSDVYLGTIYDYIQVSTGTAVPVSGTLPATGIVFGPYPSANVTSFTEQTVTLPASVAGTTTNLIFSFKADTVSPNGAGGVDDISLTYTMPACPSPGGLVVIPTANSVNMSWTGTTTPPAEGYQIGVTDSDTPPTTLQTVNGTTGSVGQLISSNQYYAWVRSACGNNTYSSWVKVQFTTPCDAVNVPYLENFESVTPPALTECTIAVKTGLANMWQTNATTEGGHSSNTLRYMYTYAGAANTWFFTKGVNLTAGTSYRISYKYGGSSTYYVEKLKVAYGLAQNVAGMTNQLADYPSISTTTYSIAEHDFVPTTTGVYYFGFHAYSASGQNYLYIDDISVDVSPTCLPPTGLTATATAPTSINISWTAAVPVPGNGYEYYVSTENVAPDTATDGVDVLTGTSATYTALSNQQYYIWVRSICSGTDKSQWTQAVSIVTPCNPVSAPFIEEFSNGVKPDCWTNTSSNPVTNGVWKFTGAVDYATGNTRPNGTFAWVDGSEPSNINNVTLTTPLINTAGLALPYLVFDYYSNNTTTNPNNPFTVQVQMNGAWTTVYTNNTSLAQWRTIELPLANYTGATIQIRFVVDKTVAGTNAFYNDILIDNVKLIEAPTCIKPVGLAAVATGANSINISWSAAVPAPANGYEYFVSTENIAPDLAFDGTDVPTGTSATYTAMSNQVYYIWVRSVCSPTDKSEWTPAVTVTTPCDPVNVPYLEDFESVTAPTLPECTVAVKTGAANIWQTNAATTGGFSSNVLRYYYSYSGAANTWFFTKGINLTAGTSYRISYKYGGASAAYVEKLKVAYGTTATANGMTNQLADYPSITTTTYTTAGIDFVPATTGVYYFGFQAYSASGQNVLFVDDISVDLSPTCLAPANVSATATSTTSISISWNVPTVVPGEGYEYYISTQNVVPNAATDGTDVPTGTSATYTAIPNQQYYVWVRSVCSQNDKSEWSAVAAVKTPCDAVNVPYVQDFESVNSTPALPDCTMVQNAGTGNNWTTATVTNFGFNGKVLRYAYHSTNNANAWFFTHGINLIQGTTYRISYKYGNSGGTEYVESMKVAYGTAPNASAMNTVLKDYPEIDFNVAETDYADFTPATSGVYYFGFNAYSEFDQDRLFLDNITIDVTMGNEEFMSHSFSFHPNPVTDVLNLSSVSEIGTVEVYNMLGQKVHTSKANATDAKIDMSNLADGSYIVNVTYGKTVKTIKVVKRQ